MNNFLLYTRNGDQEMNFNLKGRIEKKIKRIEKKKLMLTGH